MITAPATGYLSGNGYRKTPRPRPGFQHPAGTPSNPTVQPPPNNGMPTTTPPPIDYRGGETGVGADFGLRDNYASQMMNNYFAGQMGQYNNRLGMNSQFAGMAGQGYLNDFNNRQSSALAGNNNIRSQAAGMSTAAQLAAAKGTLGQALGGFGQSDSFFSNLMNNGMYTRDQMNQLEANAYGQVTAAGRTAGDNINNAMAARGLGANPLAAAAMNMRAAFEGAGARGNMSANLQREQAQSKIQGAQGHAGNAAQKAGIYGQMAQYDAAPTQEGALAMLQDVPQYDGNGLQGILDSYQNRPVAGPDFSGAQALYDQLRNLLVGPGAGLQKPPDIFNSGGNGGYGGIGGGPINGYPRPIMR